MKVWRVTLCTFPTEHDNDHVVEIYQHPNHIRMVDLAGWIHGIISFLPLHIIVLTLPFFTAQTDLGLPCLVND